MALPSYAMNLSSFPELYELWLVAPLFLPWAEILLDRVGLHAGDRVIDIACGTGIVARTAKARLGPDATVVAVDVSPQMLVVARRVEPGIDWREGNAAALPCAPEETFDVVTCQQGLQFMPDKAAAAREMRRVLAPGGRLGVAAWRPLDDIPLLRDLHRVAERHVGPIADARHSFGESAPLAQLLKDAGLKDVVVETLTRPVHFGEPGAFVRLNTMALIGMSARSKTMSDDERARAVDAIVTDSEPVAATYATADGFAFDITSSLATARA